mgnify:CR=1 FL=1
MGELVNNITIGVFPLMIFDQEPMRTDKFLHMTFPGTMQGYLNIESYTKDSGVSKNIINI